MHSWLSVAKHVFSCNVVCVQLLCEMEEQEDVLVDVLSCEVNVFFDPSIIVNIHEKGFCIRFCFVQLVAYFTSAYT